MAPYVNGVNNRNFHSMVWPPASISPIITQLMNILNGYVADCQEFWWVVNISSCFWKRSRKIRKKIVQEARFISYLWPTMGRGLTWLFWWKHWGTMSKQNFQDIYLYYKSHYNYIQRHLHQTHAETVDTLPSLKVTS